MRSGIVQRKVVPVEAVRHSRIAETSIGPPSRRYRSAKTSVFSAASHQFVAIADHVQDRDFARREGRGLSDRVTVIYICLP